MVSASGVNAQSEVITSRGRIDLVVEFDDKIYIIEFKCGQSAKAGLKQIKEKGYAEIIQKTGKKLILMGINFDSEKKNAAEWEMAQCRGESQLAKFFPRRPPLVFGQRGDAQDLILPKNMAWNHLHIKIPDSTHFCPRVLNYRRMTPITTSHTTNHTHQCTTLPKARLQTPKTAPRTNFLSERRKPI